MPEAIAISAIYAYRGEKDQAYVWLDRALNLHDAEIVLQLPTDPLLAGIRSDPRFQALLKN